ncbi:MAG: glycosyltransferase family 2 protein [Candidatus Omnitrophica bacterium]|jgi:glycosyltransferase involved in cell wall biosynthesis|nr:glycosyltransferase [Candidatus Omnitrophota bacterium]MDD5080189.1 glycosyltransferase family 2 protein [Candidatus Omnitrophota bacterium]
MISVVIITYNRKLLLKDCLNSVLGQNNCPDFEIIVVDNHSSDRTADLIRDNFRERLRLIPCETRLSLAEAKRLGLNACAGDIIAFTDDDCLAGKNWLKEINLTLSRNDFCGGPTLLKDISLPRWWNGSLNWMIGINTLPGVKFPPLGGNAAFRKYVLDRVEKDAPPRELLPYGEDNWRIRKALAAGFSLGINKDMVVYHQIPQKKLTLSFLFQRSAQEGRCLANYDKKTRDIAYNLFSIPANLLRSLFFLDLNRFFRMIVNLSYLINRLKRPKNER